MAPNRWPRPCSKAQSVFASLPQVSLSRHELSLSEHTKIPIPDSTWLVFLALAGIAFAWVSFARVRGRIDASSSAVRAPRVLGWFFTIASAVFYVHKSGYHWITILDKGILVLIFGSIGFWLYWELVKKRGGREEVAVDEVEGFVLTEDVVVERDVKIAVERDVKVAVESA